MDDIHKLYMIDDLDDIELIDRIFRKLKLRLAEQEDLDILNTKFTSANAEYILSLTKALKG